MLLKSNRKNIIKGGLIFASGDAIASLIIDDFNFIRLIGMLLTGAFIYAFEIPNYFQWIENVTQRYSKTSKSVLKVILAVAYFNPVWIFRHMVILKLLSQEGIQSINFQLLYVSLKSFFINLPFALPINFVIQNKIPLQYRFVASALFSAIMAIYYALSLVWLS